MTALPHSLATTRGISVDFFSCCYLDVSVRNVRSTYPIYSGRSDLTVGFPHSEISGSKLYCQLPEAYRRLTRLSSPVVAKASTTCTYSLDPIILNPVLIKTNPSTKLQVFALFPHTNLTLSPTLKDHGEDTSQPMFGLFHL